MTLVRWNPARELLNFEREFGKIFNSFGNRFGNNKERDEEYESAVWTPLTDIVENEDNYILKIDIPGVEKNDVKISYSKGELSISGERKHEEEKSNSTYHRIERVYGKYYRRFALPERIREDKIEAEFKNGSLVITVPKAEEVKVKEIEVKVK